MAFLTSSHPFRFSGTFQGSTARRNPQLFVCPSRRILRRYSANDDNRNNYSVTICADAQEQQPQSNIGAHGAQFQHSLDTLLKTLKSSASSASSSPSSIQNFPQSESRHSETEKTTTSENTTGVVYLVGTGPGDPGLLTLRALQLMSRADVILYDRLVSDDILSFVNPQATMIYVGKEAGFHTRSQDEIHLLLSFFALSHSTVVRLKGGDPFIFGRGGEEIEFLEQAGVHVIAIPGITAASGIAAMLGVPLTMRGYATSVRYLTGHIMTGVNLDFGHIDNHTTYVVYMGLAQIESITNQLIEQGIDRDTAAVAVQKGTTREQRILCAHLHELHHLVEKAQFCSPTLIIIGKVVSLGMYWERRGEVVECNSNNSTETKMMNSVDYSRLEKDDPHLRNNLTNWINLVETLE